MCELDKHLENVSFSQLCVSLSTEFRRFANRRVLHFSDEIQKSETVTIRDNLIFENIS